MTLIGVDGRVDAEDTPHPMPFDPIVWPIMGLFFGMALYGTLDITFLVLTTFKRWSGLYFWSLLIVAWAITIHNVGNALNYMVASANWGFYVFLDSFGWWLIQVFMSLVLYSRLHLVVRNQRTLKMVLALIVAAFVCLCIPNTTLFFLTNDPRYGPEQHKRASYAFSVMDRIQVIGWMLMDAFLAALYIPNARKLLRPSLGKGIDNIVMQLIAVLILTVTLDLCMVVLNFSGLIAMKCVLQSFFVAVKLRVEFFILNQLMNITRQGPSDPALKNGAGQKDSESGFGLAGGVAGLSSQSTMHSDRSDKKSHHYHPWTRHTSSE